ncbi:MAG: hypothetical protein ACKVHR_07610 [Pirellulales bacterium]
MIRIRMYMQAFAQFCLHSGDKNDGAGRSAFANLQAGNFLGNASEPNAPQ